MKKRFLVILMTVIMLLTFSVECFAESDEDYGIAPCYINMNDYDFSFIVIEPGVAIVEVSYYGNSSKFSYAKLTVKIQKKVFWFIWETVDIGEPDNEWSTSNFELNGNFYNEFPVDETGTYRAVYTLEIYGNTGISGKVDVVEGDLEFEYD